MVPRAVKLTANEPESLALWGNDVGRMDGQPERENGGTVGWTEDGIQISIKIHITIPIKYLSNTYEMPVKKHHQK